MSRAPRRPEPLAGRVFHSRDALRQGLLTRNDLRSTAWRQLFHNVYADARVHVSHRTRCAAAARWLLPSRCAIAGRSALGLLGGTSPAPEEPVEVLVDPVARFGPLRGLRIHVAPLPEDEIRMMQGIPVTTAVRTSWDLASWLDPVEAVTAIDSLLAGRAVTVDDLRAYAEARRGERGWRRLAGAVELADGGAESPQESRLRVRLVQAGLPVPVTQFVITHNGHFLARVDLAWPELRIAVEYDGLWHDDPARFHRDRRRLNRLLGADWIVLHVTAKRLREDFDGVVAEIRAAMRTRR